MRRVFATIITEDYLPFARTLFQSIREIDRDLDCVALVVNPSGIGKIEEFDLLYLDQLTERDLVSKLKKKYHQKSNVLRWSLKSVLMIHLLKSNAYDQVFFVDPDLNFYSDFTFIYEELGSSSFLLSPNWGCMNPEKSEPYFIRLMTDGLYNAGFLGATIKGLNTLFWWANMCLYACEKDKSRGLHDDQAYFNLFPILNPDTKILTHRGCNVAEWNRFECARITQKDGSIKIDDLNPIVFIHFSNISYLMEFDKLLIPYLDEYSKRLQDNGLEYDIRVSAKSYIDRTRLRSLSLGQRVFRKLIGKKRFSKFMKWE